MRALGFDSVHEVAFGADLVAAAYKQLVSKANGHQYISSVLPGHRGIRRTLSSRSGRLPGPHRFAHGRPGPLPPLEQPDLKIVFIGPCIAKKTEAEDEQVRGEIDAVLTFRELREMLASEQIDRRPHPKPSDFDPPYGGSGALYPISRGALQASGFREDLITGEIISTQGRNHVREVIQEFADRNLRAKLLEVLCCEGCIMGAGMTSEQPLFFRRRRVAEYVSHRMANLSSGEWKKQLAAGKRLSLWTAVSGLRSADRGTARRSTGTDPRQTR